MPDLSVLALGDNPFLAPTDTFSARLAEVQSLKPFVLLQLFSGGAPLEFGEFKELVNLSLYNKNLTRELPEILGHRGSAGEDDQDDDHLGRAASETQKEEISNRDRPKRLKGLVNDMEKFTSLGLLDVCSIDLDYNPKSVRSDDRVIATGRAFNSGSLMAISGFPCGEHSTSWASNSSDTTKAVLGGPLIGEVGGFMRNIYRLKSLGYPLPPPLVLE
ncbi:hypothetical protein HU200_010521 [Digitaria exilis]|uniref:Uncharacterized protein n=1 Tax=Digitaria exilis TaxID=1010633 RepID=A0A835KNN7_9POAL|nr:hypothetical protein HU200_010521 [Digitaria exilis]